VVDNIRTGDRIEVMGDRITITYRDKTTETIVGGRFEMKDSLGRRIVERAVTNDDFDRLVDLAR
jgi:hypothetical protein